MNQLVLLTAQQITKYFLDLLFYAAKWFMHDSHLVREYLKDLYLKVEI